LITRILANPPPTERTCRVVLAFRARSPKRPAERQLAWRGRDKMSEMTEEPLAKGWHPDPAETGLDRFWDGHGWNGTCGKGAQGHTMDHFSLRGGRRIWYVRVLRFPVVFYPLAWLNCSVSGTRGHLGRLVEPAQARGRPAS
jgi:hypothetical protein